MAVTENSNNFIGGATILELKRQIANCEYMKNHVIAENTLKIQELDKVYGELSDEYRTLIREHGALLIDKGNIQKELDRLRAILREKCNEKEVHTGTQGIFKGELEHILEYYYGYNKVHLLNYRVLDIRYEGVKEE
jgi:hypothetical protein